LPDTMRRPYIFFRKYWRRVVCTDPAICIPAC
jgi:hypothetical protein